MRVTLVTTWDAACGISEHAWYLKAAIEGADPSIRIEPEPDLHPDAVLLRPGAVNWLWLNYHAALHSRWTPEAVKVAQTKGMKVGITYHDTGVPNSEQCRALHAVADAFVIHEPAEDLPGAVYLRQGVPEMAPVVGGGKRLFPQLPVVGTVGFPFPWKNIELLCDAAERAGWAVLLLTPGATEEQVAKWKAIHGGIHVRTEFTPRAEVIKLLASCDATAFLYSNANTGTSAAIRQGIAARKPVIASSVANCRQFRDLDEDEIARNAIRWVGDLTPDKVADALTFVEPLAFDPWIARLAHQDRWQVSGEAYARILRGGGQ